MVTAGRAVGRRFPFVKRLRSLFILVGITPVVLRRVSSVPGPLRVDVVTHTGSPAGRLTLEVTPTGTATESSALRTPQATTTRGTVDFGPMDRPGLWELVVGDGHHVTRIPFVPAELERRGGGFS